MVPLLSLVLLWSLLPTNSEKHSLTYKYTAISKPSGIPGVHEFTAMALLDGRRIDYYDSETQKKVPKQSWIKRLKPADYWSQGSESRKREHEWLKINIDFLLKRTKQENDTDSHTLQWLRGCEGDLHPGSNMTLGQVMDRYSWDGEDFLSFDDADNVWVAHSRVALQTKMKWDSDTTLSVFTKGYRGTECLGFLGEFVNCEQEDLKSAASSEVYTFQRNARVETNTILVCMATGFISEDTMVQIKQDGRRVTRQDGIMTGEALPNEDETFQRTVHVEILKSDESNFTCEVFDVATKHSVRKVWEDKPAETSVGSVVGGVVGGLVVVLVLVVVVVLVKRQRRSLGEPQGEPQGEPSLMMDQDDKPHWKSDNTI